MRKGGGGAGKTIQHIPLLSSRVFVCVKDARLPPCPHHALTNKTKA